MDMPTAAITAPVYNKLVSTDLPPSQIRVPYTLIYGKTKPASGMLRNQLALHPPQASSMHPAFSPKKSKMQPTIVAYVIR